MKKTFSTWLVEIAGDFLFHFPHLSRSAVLKKAIAGDCLQNCVQAEVLFYVKKE